MASPLNWFSQVISVVKFSILTVPQRKGSAAASAVGTAGVVGVLVGVLSIAQGFRAVMSNSGDPGVAMVMRSGSDSEMMSVILGNESRIIADFPGIARGPDGPLASAELFVVINLPKRSTGTDANVPMRGLDASAFQVHSEVKILEGRRFEAGRNEIIVGRGALIEFAGLELGSKLQVGRNEWTVVGVFSAGGGISESEIWTDAAVLQDAYQRGNSFQSVFVRLTSPAALQPFKDALTTDPRLNVKVVRQNEYYAEQSTMLYNLVTGLGSLIAGLMGVGAIFGALNTMYTAVSARTREIATLRALGFGGGPVVVSVLFESLLLSLVGGAIGAGLAYALFDGFRASTLNWQSFSQVTFAFAVTPQLLVQGAVYAALIGLLGGLFPAIRAARMPVAAALREL
ncbi:MAG: FtsX-like permease family protein [Verrucomicrobia bacterium]|nr:FtsX-like permease family protein [Verrucomicrobiota bacterium]